MRVGSARASRILLASGDRGFLNQAVAKLRGAPLHLSVVIQAERVVQQIARLNPHVVILSEAFLDSDPTLVQVLPKRFPGLPILVVGANEVPDRKANWEVMSWGGVGRVPKEDLLRGQVLLTVIVELLRLRSKGGATSL